MIGVFAAALAGGAWAMSVEPGALYLNESCSDVQFRDAEGRPLAFGWYPKAKYVTAPPDAASAEATLVRV